MPRGPHKRPKQDPPIRSRTALQLRPHPKLYALILAQSKRVGGIPVVVAEKILADYYGLDVETGEPLPNGHDQPPAAD